MMKFTTFILGAIIGLATALPTGEASVSDVPNGFLTNTLDTRQTCTIKLTSCHPECKRLTEELNGCLCINKPGGTHGCISMDKKLKACKARWCA
ncbi:hypothetical protein P153DRAFT_427952 [Dothidotthia symphoricarpi CBS 119687]|uniref:Extracellular membrane protein CFEM domain-containing protein n=1 Tax=Dothidotthia symphoricarpi CBS 119687 TaxID=1392245 RepID=A0A6A6ASA9_9PLEO|nr:uncharacterized protein P153DRAFT_427952 [Dothidotthia symphoricarpi CBS 119687]KAF2134093.1 hypothetical protein P153DRAFT_427952 [Dothidotthia symphoricarpi CBS 119687]